MDFFRALARLLMLGCLAVGFAACQDTQVVLGSAGGIQDYSRSLLTLSTSQTAVGESVDVTLEVKGPSDVQIAKLDASDVAISLSGNGLATVESITKTAPGVFVASVRALAATRDLKIGALVRGTEIFTKRSLSIFSFQISVSLSTLAATAATVAANASVTINLQVRDTSGSGADLAGLIVSFSASGGTSTGVLGTVTDLGAGAYRTTFRGVKSGTATTIRATVLGSTVTQSAAVTVTPGAAASLVKKAGDAQTVAAGSTLPVDPLVQVVDALGNPVPGVTTTWTLAAGNGTLSPDTNANTSVETIVSDASGFATLDWTLPTSIGAKTLAVTAAGVVTGLSFSATASSGAPNSLSLVSGVSQSAAVGTVLSAPLVVQVRDAMGNDVSGVSVTWTIVSGGGSVSAASSQTNSLGKAQITWTLGGTLGTQRVKATIASTLLEAQFTASATVGPVNRIQIVSGNEQVGDARTLLVDPVVAEIRDAFNNPISGVAVTWTVTSGAGTLSNKVTTSTVTGQVSANWKLGALTGNQLITVAAGSKSATFSAEAQPRPVKTLTAMSGNSQTVAINQQAADLVVKATDAAGLLISGADVTWTVRAGNGRLASVTSVTNDQGLATMSYVMGPLIGTNTVRATADDRATPTDGIRDFTLTGDWDSNVKTYLARSGLGHVTDPDKYKINNFVSGLKKEGIWTKLSEMWLMKGIYNRNTGTVVYGIKSTSTNGTITGAATWGANGIKSTGTGNPPPYVQLAGTLRTSYTQRTILVSLTPEDDTVDNIYATTANNDFGAVGSGEGFRVGNQIAWGDGTDVGNADQSALTPNQETMLATTFRNGEIVSYLNGSSQRSASIPLLSLTDSKTIRLMANQTGTLTDRGLNGSIAFFADFSSQLTTYEVNFVYDLYLETIKQ